MLIVADYEALQGIRDSQNLSPIQQCIIKGPVMKDMADILGEEVGVKEGGRASSSRSTLISRRSSLNPVPAHGNLKVYFKNVFIRTDCCQFQHLFLVILFQNVDIPPEVWVPERQFVKSGREYVPVDVPELQLQLELKKAFIVCNFVE